MNRDAGHCSHVEAYACAFRGLLWRDSATELQARVQQLLDEVQQRTSDGDESEDAFRFVYARERDEIVARMVADNTQGGGASRNGRKFQQLLDEFLPIEPRPDGPDFHCDAGLGGLAKLLRAAGYDAAFWPGIDDDELLQKTLAGSAILLTNDTLLMRRGVIERRIVPAVLVPITIKKREQFARVVRELQLPLGRPRCMACGGRLVAVDKEAMRERIPPRTFPWRDDYFVCERCDKLFWRGTHWEKIRGCLAEVAGQSAG